MSKVDKAEVLRYLGYRGQDINPELHTLIDDVLQECEALAKPLTTWQSFPLEHTPGGILVQGTTLVLPGKHIARHLMGAEHCALLAATLGAPLDRAITRYEHTDLTRSVILDSAATALIEQVCDQVEATIQEKTALRGRRINSRFSPGYGDLPLELQPTLLEVLQTAKRIGLTCQSSMIMLPRKSVSAIIGIFPGKDAPPATQRKCESCAARETCRYRKDGVACESPATI